MKKTKRELLFNEVKKSDFYKQKFEALKLALPAASEEDLLESIFVAVTVSNIRAVFSYEIDPEIRGAKVGGIVNSLIKNLKLNNAGKIKACLVPIILDLTGEAEQMETEARDEAIVIIDLSKRLKAELEKNPGGK